MSSVCDNNQKIVQKAYETCFRAKSTGDRSLIISAITGGNVRQQKDGGEAAQLTPNFLILGMNLQPEELSKIEEIFQQHHDKMTQ
jgi:hypothetical protein